jgi:hypothetical protein
MIIAGVWLRVRRFIAIDSELLVPLLAIVAGGVRLAGGMRLRGRNG